MIKKQYQEFQQKVKEKAYLKYEERKKLGIFGDTPEQEQLLREQDWLIAEKEVKAYEQAGI